MERRLRREEVMTIEVLHERGMSNRAIARQLGVHEHAVRYRLARPQAGARDGRADKPFAAAPWAEAIASWMQAAEAGGGMNGRALYEWLVAEHGYGGSYKAVQRYVRAHYGRPAVRVRRRVETPPGAQAQADWGEFPGVDVGDGAMTLHAFHLVLSHSRMEAIVWAARQDELAWLAVHNGALTRLGGVPAVIRVDNTKTAIVQRRRAMGHGERALRGLCPHAALPRGRDAAAGARGEGQGRAADPGAQDGLRSAAPRLARCRGAAGGDAMPRCAQSAERRLCPATGETVWTSFLAEQPLLQPLPGCLPEPFDLVVQRRVARDATVSFEGRTYSVPFRFAEQVVEVRGCAGTVQVWAEAELVAAHPRHTRQRLLIDPTHYDGPSTDRVAAPTPLGRMGRKLQERWALAPQRRPIDLYAALAEVAR